MRRLGLLLLPALLAQEPPAIRVNVNLIEVDATVTGKKGRRLAGRTAAGFEVFQNGRRQKISSALWVAVRPPVAHQANLSPRSLFRGGYPSTDKLGSFTFTVSALARDS